VGSTLSEIVRLSHRSLIRLRHGLLVQIRRDAVGSNRAPFLADRMSVNIAPADVDQLAATLQHKITHGRLYLT